MSRNRKRYMITVLQDGYKTSMSTYFYAKWRWTAEIIAFFAWIVTFRNVEIGDRGNG